MKPSRNWGFYFSFKKVLTFDNKKIQYSRIFTILLFIKWALWKK